MPQQFPDFLTSILKGVEINSIRQRQKASALKLEEQRAKNAETTRLKTEKLDRDLQDRSARITKAAEDKALRLEDRAFKLEDRGFKEEARVQKKFELKTEGLGIAETLGKQFPRGRDVGQFPVAGFPGSEQDALSALSEFQENLRDKGQLPEEVEDQLLQGTAAGQASTIPIRRLKELQESTGVSPLEAVSVGSPNQTEVIKQHRIDLKADITAERSELIFNQKQIDRLTRLSKEKATRLGNLTPAQKAKELKVQKKGISNDLGALISRSTEEAVDLSFADSDFFGDDNLAKQQLNDKNFLAGIRLLELEYPLAAELPDIIKAIQRLKLERGLGGILLRKE